MSYYDETLDRIRAALVENALRMSDGNHARAAQLLGIKRSRFLGILRRQKRDAAKIRQAAAIGLVK